MEQELAKNNPKVSIIIPTHNRSELLPQTLESVREQTFEAFECIIIDDHSEDYQTCEIAQNYSVTDKRFTAYELPESKHGVNAARNFGLELSQTDFVNFLDSDDIFTPNKLEIQFSEMKAKPNLDMVTCRHQPFTNTPGDIDEQLKFAPKENHNSLLSPKIFS